MLLPGGWVGSLDVDPEKGKLYVPNFVGKTVEEINLDGSQKRTLYGCPSNPRGTAVDLTNRFVC